MIYRFIHQQSGNGKLLIDDIEDGTGTETLARYDKQPVYIPFDRQYFDQNKKLVVDTDHPGFVDLVESDSVLLSRNNGTLAGFKKQNLVSEVTFKAADAQPPSVASAEHDDTSASNQAFEVAFTVTEEADSTTGDYTITINGTDHTVSDTDSGSTTASNLAGSINGGSESGVVTASASGNTVTVTSDVLDTPFTYASSATGTSGSEGISESVTHTGKVILTGNRFTSIEPFETEVTLVDTGNSTKTFTATQITNNADSKITKTVIVLGASLHGLGNANGDVDDVTVKANDKTDSSSVSALS